MGWGRSISTVLLVAAAIGPALPSAPCDGVRIFERAGFDGAELPVLSDIPDLGAWGMDDDGESILVPGGCRAVFYAEKGYRGRRLEVLGPAYSRDLAGGDWSDVISSVRIHRARSRPGPALRGRELLWEARRRPGSAARTVRLDSAPEG